MKTMLLSGMLNRGPEKVEMCVDELMYRSYSYGRSRNPARPPEKYSLLFADWKNYEEKYQRALKAQKEAMI